MQISTIVEAIHELDDEQLAFIIEAAVQRVGVLGDVAIISLTEYLSGRPEDGDFVDGLELLQGFVTGNSV